MYNGVDSNKTNTFVVDNGGLFNYYDANRSIYTKNSGGSKAHNNLQPYVTVYMYRRTK